MSTEVNSKNDLKLKEELEKEKLRNEIELQEFQIRDQKELTGWRKKTAHFSKEWGQTLATLFLGIVGIIFTINNNTNQEKSNRIMMATQLMSSREKSETDFRQAMFLPLINQILADTLPLEKRFAVLQIFQNNFNELFNSRALFDVLDEAAYRKINGSKRTDSALGIEIHKRLISLARKTNQDQELMIGGEQIIKNGVTQGEQYDTIMGVKDGIDEAHEFIITVDSVTKEYLIAKVKLLNPNTTKETIVLNNGKPIKITYYDSPLTDNILLPDKHRFAVTLEDIFPENGPGPYKAKLKIIHFPTEFITTGYRPSVKFVKEMLDNQ